MHLHFTLLLVSIFAARCLALSCTVDNTGGTPDYTLLSDAIANCRGPFPDLDVILLVQGTHSLAGVPLPTHITLLHMQSLTGNSADFVISEVGMVIDESDPGAQPAVVFVNATFQLNNSATPLFTTPLGNQNFTMLGCNIQNSSADPFLTQEVCKNDQVILVLRGLTITDHPFRLLNATGLSGWTITDNHCIRCGANLSAGHSLVYLKQSDVPQFPRIFNLNDFYRTFNCRLQPRCLYSIGGNGFYARCNRGRVECYDRVRTQERGNCPVVPITLTDPDTNATEVVMEHDVSCRVYGPCVCTGITYLNVSRSGEQITLAGGNLVYGGSTVKTILPCRPRITDPFGKKLILYRHKFFTGSTYVNYGDDDKSFNDVFKDRASSAKVGPGYTVTLFKDSNYGGQSVNITLFNTNFEEIDFDNKATSLRWVPVPWASADVPIYNSTIDSLPLPVELAQSFGYYEALWRQPVTQVYFSSTNPLLGQPYPFSYNPIVRETMSFDDSSSFFMYFDAGQIYPRTCPIVDCQNTPGGDGLPCDYVVYPADATNPTNDTKGTLEGTPGFGMEVDGAYAFAYPTTPFDAEDYLGAHCLNGHTYCCQTPDDATPNYPAYAVDCSSSPNASIPITFPNGTIVDGNSTQIPEEVYHCTYLVNCTYDEPNNELDGCVEFHCGLTPCRLNVTYEPGDFCYDKLELGDAERACNGSNPGATSQLCTFLQAGCDHYYYNGYLKEGYRYASDIGATGTVVPSTCEFRVEDCVAEIASADQQSFKSSLCYCSWCQLSSEATTCDLSASPPSPLPLDAACISAALTATSSATLLDDCINNVSPDDGCNAAREACDLTQVPPLLGMVDGERCYSTVQTFFSSVETTADCMNPLFVTADTGCLLARQACQVARFTRPYNLPCLYAVMNGATPTPAPTDTAFPPPAPFPPSTGAPQSVDPCFDEYLASPNATCTTARATCNVYWPQPYACPDAGCYMTQMALAGSTDPLYLCINSSFDTPDAGCVAARAACPCSLCYDYLELGATNADEDCSNPYASDDTVNSFCLFVRYNCDTYYAPGTAELAAGFCFASDPTCVGTVIPGECELDDAACANGDTRCTCSGSFPTAPDVSILTVEDIVYGQPDLGFPYVKPASETDGNQWPIFEPSSDPVRLPRPLRFEDTESVCPTQLWAACHCPPETYQLSTTVLQSCQYDNESGYCLPDTYTFDYTAAAWSNASINGTILALWPNHDYWTMQLSKQIGVTGLFCSATTKRMKCDCSFARLVALLDPPPPNTTAIHFDNLRVNTTDLQIVDNAACDYFYGLRQDQSDPLLIRKTAFALPHYFDTFSLHSDLWRNPNDYILGQIDFVAEPHSYDPRICIDGCPQSTWGGVPYGFSESEADYIVDGGVNTRSPSYGITIFRSLYHLSVASSPGENKKVFIRDWGQNYDEPMPFPCPPDDSSCTDNTDSDDLEIRWTKDNRNWWFYSDQSPVVVVQNMLFDTPGVVSQTWQGIHFFHPGGSRNPIFKARRESSRSLADMESLNFLNCKFDGGGVRSAGILTLLGQVTDVIFSHCDITNWNLIAVNLNRVRNFIFVGNTVSLCTGNAIHARVIHTYSVRDNVFIDTRGGGDIKGAVVLKLTGVNELGTAGLLGYGDLFAGLSYITDTPVTCFNDTAQLRAPYYPGALPINATDRYSMWEFRCHIWNNVHITDLLSDDYRDTFIEVWEGRYTESTIIGNSVLKAQFGIALYGTTLQPTPEELDLLARQNPRVKPTRYRSIDVPAGADFKGITQTSWVEIVFGFAPRTRETWECNWPCNSDVGQMFRVGNISCGVNNAWSPKTMEESYYWNVLRLERRWAYGYAEFRNVSDAAQFCFDFREYGIPAIEAPEVFVLPWSGSEFLSDNVSLVRPIRILGDPSGAFRSGVMVMLPGSNVSVPMDQAVPLPTRCSLAHGVRPCVRAPGNTIATTVVRFEDMCWQLAESILGYNLWSSADPAPVGVEIYRNEFDGRNILPVANAYALLIYCGVIFPTNDQTAPEQTDELPIPTSCTIVMRDSIVANFTSYEARVVSTSARGRNRRVQLTGYPINSGAVFIAINRLNANTYAEIVNNTFLNIDRTPLTLRGFINATIEFNLSINGSGRSIGNTAACFIEGNNLYSTEPDESNDEPPGRGYYSIRNNTWYQEKTILTPFGSNFAFPVMLPGFYLRSLPQNTTLCIFGNVIKNYPVGWRFTDFNLTIMVTCPAPGQVVGFPDALRFMRFVALNNGCDNPDINGTVFDLETTFEGSHTEATRDALHCEFCCPPGPPTACWVDLSTILFNPAHPWWDWAVFNSYNRAITNCNISSGNIFIIGSSDPFLAYDGLSVPFKVYTEVFFETIPATVGNRTGPITIFGDAGMIILANGHSLNNPNNVSVTLQGIDFVDAGGAAPIWDWTNAALFTNLITLRRNIFDGNGTATNRAIDGTFDGRFEYSGNVHRNYTALPVSVAHFEGEFCDTHFVIKSNRFTDLPGNCMDVHAADFIDFQDNYCTRCGGSTGPADPDRWVFWVNPTCIGTPGVIRYDRNRVRASASVDANPTRPMWTAHYIDPVPWKLTSPYVINVPGVTTKFMSFYDNRAEGLLIGTRLANDHADCFSGNAQNFLRLVMYSRFRNARVDGTVFDLYRGPFNTIQEQTVKANMDAADMFDISDPTACQHCNDGCPVFQFALGTIVLIALAIGILVCLALTCWACPMALGCCGTCLRPASLVYDPTTQTYIFNNSRDYHHLIARRTPANLRTGVRPPPVAETGGLSPTDQHLTTGGLGGVTSGMLKYRGYIRANPIPSQQQPEQ